ncbi:MAG: transcription termination factor NusA [Sphingomonadales bacterium]
MTAAVGANKLEILQIADAVAKEKAIDREIVIEAMEEAIQKAAKARYGSENNIRAQIDRDSGNQELFRILEVVAEVENPSTEITLEEARMEKPEAEVGEFIAERLPPIDYSRISAQTAKQVIVQKVRSAERERQFEEFKDRVGEIITGIVKRVEYGNVIVDLGRAEAIIPRDHVIPREHLRNNERIRSFIREVRRENRGPQIFLSRTVPEFMAQMFAQEVPEIYDGVIEIKAVARDPGSRAKIAVISHDSGIDPVGACVGMRGSRVQAVVSELQGEKIDIIQWTQDVATLVVNALAPAQVVKVVLDEDETRIEVVVPDDQLSLAIGRRGQNVRLASKLTGWTIDILTEAEESERRQEEFKTLTKMFIETLDVDETLAQLLAAEGFSDYEEVAYIEAEELISIEGFDEALVAELQSRAMDAIENKRKEADKKRKKLGVTDDLAKLIKLEPALLVILGENDVKTIEDFAGFAADELVSPFDGILKGSDLSEGEASELIMAARVKVGWITAAELKAAKAEAKAAEEALAAEAAAAEEAEAKPEDEAATKEKPEV